MPAGNTYTQIASTTLGSAADTVTFSSIPSTYTDVIVVVSAALTTGSANMYVNFNNDTSSIYSTTYLSGTGSSAVTSRNSGVRLIPTFYGYLETTIGNFVFNVMNYANTSTFKTMLARTNNTVNGTNASVGLWRNTAAINRIDIIAASSTFIAGSTFNLYGITAA